jgi:hypothetical protein
MELHR